MGGKILELESDKLIQRGIEQGIAMERKKTEAAEAEIQRLKSFWRKRITNSEFVGDNPYPEWIGVIVLYCKIFISCA